MGYHSKVSRFLRFIPFPSTLSILWQIILFPTPELSDSECYYWHLVNAMLTLTLTQQLSCGQE